MKTFLLLLLTATVLVAAEPKRESGLSVHMLPDRVAKIDGGHGGFTVSAQNGRNDETTYGEPKDLLAHVQRLPAATQENGIWIVVTNPVSYSDAEHTRLKNLIALCTEKNIPVFTCRGADLPNGWKRAR